MQLEYAHLVPDFKWMNTGNEEFAGEEPNVLIGSAWTQLKHFCHGHTLGESSIEGTRHKGY